MLLASLPAAADGKAFRPSDDTLVLGPASGEAHVGVAELAALDTDDRRAVLAYARGALARADRLQDPREAGYGLLALQRYHLRGSDPESRLLEAILLQRLHRFDDALAVLDAVIAVPSASAQARFVRSALLTLRGDYRAALDDCTALVERTDAYTVALCAALPNSRAGRAESTWATLTALLDDPTTARAPLAGYARGVHAELAWRLGRPDALALLAAWSAAGEPLARIVHADALLDSNAPADALTVLEDMPGESALVRRARALRMLATDTDGLAALATEYAAIRTARALRDDVGHAREEAYWWLHVEPDPAAALTAALANWARQREPLDAELVLDAARAAGRAEAAAPVLAWMDTHAVDDARLLARRRQLAAGAGP